MNGITGDVFCSSGAVNAVVPIDIFEAGRDGQVRPADAVPVRRRADTGPSRNVLHIRRSRHRRPQISFAAKLRDPRRSGCARDCSRPRQNIGWRHKSNGARWEAGIFPPHAGAHLSGQPAEIEIVGQARKILPQMR